MNRASSGHQPDAGHNTLNVRINTTRILRKEMHFTIKHNFKISSGLSEVCTKSPPCPDSSHYILNAFIRASSMPGLLFVLYTLSLNPHVKIDRAGSDLANEEATTPRFLSSQKHFLNNVHVCTS